MKIKLCMYFVEYKDVIMLWDFSEVWGYNVSISMWFLLFDGLD